MATGRSPTRPRNQEPIVDPHGRLTRYGVQLLESMWRQVAAGYVIVPVVVTQADVNVLTLQPLLHEEGGETLAQGMAFWGTAAQNSTGAVTAILAKPSRALPAVKVYKSNGLAQAGAGDVVQNGRYLFVYDEDLDGGAGGLVLK